MTLMRAEPWSEAWSTPTLIMSDLHINGGARDQEVIDRLLWMTDPHRRELEPAQDAQSRFPIVQRVILLGDVFDFQLGFRDLVFTAHLKFLRCLKLMRNRGVEIIIFTGNHDPEAHPAFTTDLEITVCDRATLFSIYGEWVRCEHGDLLEPSWFKRSLCRIVRLPMILWIVRCFPAQFLWSLTQRWGAEHGDPELEAEVNSQKPLQTLIQRMWPTVKEGGVDRWVFGHFHQVIAWTEDQSNLPCVFVTGDQVLNHSALLWTDQGPSLLKLSSLPPVPLNIH